jgi:hypothetical protein
VKSGDLVEEEIVDVDGVEIIEQAEEYGYSWSWDDPRGFQSEILWNREAGGCNLGTRRLPGGWVHTRLDKSVWGTARTIYEAREVVERYVMQAAAKPA